MALGQTSLTAAITASQLRLPVSSTALFPAVGSVGFRQPVQIDSEFMVAVGVPTATQIDVALRGYDGTAPAAHDILSAVVTSSVPGDFGNPIPASLVTINLEALPAATVGQDGAIPLLGGNAVVNINKATAAALTLAAPTLADNGIILIVTAQTAAAHVVTATSLLADGVAGSPHSTATFAAAKGAQITLVAENGLWSVNAAVGVTVT